MRSFASKCGWLQSSVLRPRPEGITDVYRLIITDVYRLIITDVYRPKCLQCFYLVDLGRRRFDGRRGLGSS